MNHIFSSYLLTAAPGAGPPALQGGLFKIQLKCPQLSSTKSDHLPKATTFRNGGSLPKASTFRKRAPLRKRAPSAKASKRTLQGHMTLELGTSIFEGVDALKNAIVTEREIHVEILRLGTSIC